MAATESDITKEIIEVAAASGLKCEMKDKVATRKLWMLCRKCVESKSGVGKATAVDQDAPLTDEISNLKRLWSKVHGLAIPEACIFSPGLVGRISRHRRSWKPFWRRVSALDQVPRKLLARCSKY